MLPTPLEPPPSNLSVQGFHQRADIQWGGVRYAPNEAVADSVDDGGKRKRKRFEGAKEDGAHGGEKQRLLEEYPEPLTMEQRNSLRRHTTALARRFEMVRKGAYIVERGYNSLQSLLSRLESERLRLQSSLDSLEEGKSEKLQTQDIVTETNTTAENEKEQLPCRVMPSKETTQSTRRQGGLLRSAVFANLHSVLNAAKREQQQELSNVTLARERISRLTRLKIIEEDLAQQRQLLAPLTEKYQKSHTLLEAVKGEVLEALRLYDEMQRMEVAYASRFFLRASGSKGDDNDADNTYYDVFFTPAKYTDEVQEMIREQVEEKLEEYLLYRRRVDPVLQSLAEERRQRDAERADKLLKLIGVDTDTTKVAAAAAGSLDFMPHVATVLSGGDDLSTTAVGPHLLSSKQGVTVAAGQISDDDDDDNYNKNNDEDNNISGKPMEQKQRDHIQSALAALDDFEELY